MWWHGVAASAAGQGFSLAAEEWLCCRPAAAACFQPAPLHRKRGIISEYTTMYQTDPPGPSRRLTQARNTIVSTVLALLLTMAFLLAGSSASFANESAPAGGSCAATDLDCRLSLLQAQLEALNKKISPSLEELQKATVEKTKLEAQKIQLELLKLAAEEEEAKKERQQEDRKRELELRELQIDVQQKEREESKKLAVEEENLTYTFYAGVDEASVSECAKKLGEMARRSPGKPITIVLDSPGGSVLDGLHLYGFIKELRRQGHHVTVVAFGMAASMGGIILQAADVRVVHATTWILIHEVSGGAMGKVGELEDEVSFTRRLWQQLSDILAERSTMTAEEIRQKAERKDWWLSASEAKSLGFVDVVR